MNIRVLIYDKIEIDALLDKINDFKRETEREMKGIKLVLFHWNILITHELYSSAK